MEDSVQTRVTRLKKIGYGVRIWLSGKLWSDRIAKNRAEISPMIASDLRIINKCGGQSKMARASRDRGKGKQAW